MEQRILINREGPIDISHLKDRGAIARQLVLSGAGSLHSCIVSFSKNAPESNVHKELLSIKPLHERTEKLVPHLQAYPVSHFDYCNIQVFTGSVSKDDEIYLMVYCMENPGA